MRELDLVYLKIHASKSGKFDLVFYRVLDRLLYVLWDASPHYLPTTRHYRSPLLKLLILDSDIIVMTPLYSRISVDFHPIYATGARWPFIIGVACGSTSSTSCAAHAKADSRSCPSTSGAALLRFRPRFPLPLATSFAARAVRATSISSKLITFAFPSTTDLVDRRALASLFILTNV